MSKFYDSSSLLYTFFIYFSFHSKSIFLSRGILPDQDFLKLLGNSAFVYCQEIA